MRKEDERGSTTTNMDPATGPGKLPTWNGLDLPTSSHATSTKKLQMDGFATM